MLNENDVITLARTIFGEARGEGWSGKVAVASVILNRFDLKKWNAGKSIAETCLFCVKGQPYHQFSCWNKNDANYLKIKDLTREDLGDCYAVAEGVISGRLGSNVGNCTHYHTSNIKPKWSVGKMPKYTVGNHLFYDDID